MQFNKIDISVIKDPLLLNQQPSLWSLICCKLRDTTWFWPEQHGWPPRDNRYSPKAVFQETGLQYQGSMGSCRTASTSARFRLTTSSMRSFAVFNRAKAFAPTLPSRHPPCDTVTMETLNYGKTTNPYTPNCTTNIL